MTQLAVPTSVPQRRWWIWILPVAVAVLAALVYWIVSSVAFRPAAVGGDFQPVKPMDLVVRALKDGELQAVNNIDIVCEVEGRNTILTVVKEGTYAHKGDVLMTIDSSAIRQKIDDNTLDLQTRENDLKAAKEIKEIQESQNATNLEAVQVALELAKLDLQQYVEGSYPQQLDSKTTAKEMAEITVKNKQDDLDQTRSLAAKGFVTAADVKKAELDLTTAQNALDQAKTDLDVLTKYTHEMDLASKKSSLAQAEQKVVRTKKENAANIAQKSGDVETKSGALRLVQQRMERLKQQLDACTIKAPADGLVVYATSSDRNAQNPIQEGGTVNERQKLLRLPDTSSMKAVVNIGEQQASKLKPGLQAFVTVRGSNQRLTASLSRIALLSDSSQRWWNPDLKEFPVELTLDTTPAGLKPGASVDAEIIVDQANGAPAIPLASIYSAGGKQYAFVRGEPPRPVQVKLGLVNETHAQITEGLQPGDEVLTLQSGQGRQLLEQAGIKVEAPSEKLDKPEKRNPEQTPKADAPAAGSDQPAAASAEGERARRRRNGGAGGNGGNAPAAPTAPAGN
jgi:HlyD family secretion protein